MKRLSVFLCHASQDKARVREVHAWLTQSGFQPWLDEVDLLPGSDWRTAINAAIATSDVFLALLTENSISKRGFVQSEIKTALDELQNVPTGQTYVIPVKMSECDVPEPLQRLHVGDIGSVEGRERLLKALNVRASQLGRLSNLTRTERERAHEERVEAINFTMAHDDGQSLRNLEVADLVLTGLSRSGKTPLSLFLATQYGLKVANYPFIPEDIERGELPAPLIRVLPRVIALRADPIHLSQVRNARRPGSRYASLENCEWEAEGYKKLVEKYGLREIIADFTTTSIEELASLIICDYRPDRLIY